MSNLYTIENVAAFRGHEVCNGELQADPELFNEWLDEVLGEVSIGSLKYRASRVLLKVDSITYDLEKYNYEDMLTDELNEALLHEDGSQIEWVIDPEEIVHEGPEHDCSDLYNCCHCGGNNCGCAYCYACKACDSCLEYDGEGVNPNCENA